MASVNFTRLAETTAPVNVTWKCYKDAKMFTLSCANTYKDQEKKRRVGKQSQIFASKPELL